MSYKNMSNIKDSFNKAANTYDNAALIQKKIAHYLDHYLSTINLQTKHIIELGAGTGYLSQLVSQRYLYANLIATDCADKMLQKSAELNQHPHISCYSESLPFKDKFCDLILSNLMLQWCDIQSVFRESMRILKPNGHFIFTTLGPNTLQELNYCYKKIGKNPVINNFTDIETLEQYATSCSFLIKSQCIKLFIDYKPSCFDILKSLKRIGSVSLKNSHKSFKTAKQLKALDNYYRHPVKQRQFGAVYEVYLIHLVKP
jgi:malonyl-CoA O-methyltransferase